MQQELSYYIPDGSALDKVIELIRKKHDLREDPSREVIRIFLDSFDWRLYSGEVVFWVEQRDGQIALYRSGIPKAAPARRFAVTDAIPKTLGDLPDGTVKNTFASLLEMRALFPQVEVKSSVRCLRVLDSEKKTVLRIHIEDSVSRAPGKGKYAACGCRLVLQPVRGYCQPFEQVKAIIGKKSGLILAEKELLDDALSAIGKRPCSYSSKINFQFDPDMRADLAAREIHLHLLNIIEANIPGVKANLDSEFLHDLRVAVRRARSALTQIKGVFPAAEVEKYKSRMAWVGQVTGPTRDMDVYLLGFDSYRAFLPEQFREDLKPLHDFLENHRQMEHGAMVKKLNSPHFRSMMKEFRTFLEAVPEDNIAPKAATPISELANKRIYKMYLRVLQHGQAITDDSPAEHLHELRKECKKLRYLIEFFRSLYPEKKVALLIKSLKQLLDNLGSFQDLEVQAYKLRDYARQMVEEGDAPHDTMLAMGMLVDGLLTRQNQARAEFAERFARFSQSANQMIFKTLFAPTTRKGKG